MRVLCLEDEDSEVPGATLVSGAAGLRLPMRNKPTKPPPPNIIIFSLSFALSLPPTTNLSFHLLLTLRQRSYCIFSLDQNLVFLSVTDGRVANHPTDERLALWQPLLSTLTNYLSSPLRDSVFIPPS